MATLFQLQRDIVEAGRRMYARGYVASNDGNISARIDERRVLITPTGVSKGFMKPEELIIVDMNGKVLSGTKKPSSETFMHMQVYKDRPDVMCVCHAHPPYATGFAVAGIPLDKCVLPEVIITLGHVPLVEYGTPGTEELYKPVVKFVKDFDALLLANHGAITFGKDVLSAYYKMETLEHFAQIAFISQQLGQMNILSSEQVQKLTEQRSKYGIRTDVGCVSSEGETSCGNPGVKDFLNTDALSATEKEELIKEVTEVVLRKLKKHE